MSEAPVPTASQLPHIPVEVGLQIAAHLDLESARNLALICKGLRDIGEARIWSCLDLTSGLDEAPNYLLQISQLPLHTSRVDSKLQHILNSLSNYPSRETYITSIKLETSDGQDRKRATAHVEILRRVAPRLRRLELLPRATQATWNEGQKAEFGHFGFMDALNLAKIHFPKVTSLKVGCESHSSRSRSLMWLSRLAKLESLHIYSPEGHYMNAGIEIPYLEILSSIKCLKVDHISDRGNQAGLSILTRLLDNTPNLESLWLKGQWEAKRSDDAMKAMDKLEKLESLVLCDKDWATSMKYGEIMNFERFTPMFGRLEEVVKQEPDWDERDELLLEGIQLPRLAVAERLTIITNARPSNEDYISLSIGPTTAVTLFNGHSIRKFRCFPYLTQVLLLFVESPFSQDLIGPEFFVPPDRWEKEGLRGMIIRDYRDPDSADDSESLWHMRTLSRSAILPSGQAYVDIRRSWQDRTNYKGRAVPRNVLESAYKAAGVNMAWLEGGRDMTFGDDDAGWNILRDWRESVRITDRVTEDNDDGSPGAGMDNWSPPPSEDDGGGGHYMMGPHLNADGVYEDDDGVFDDDEYDAHEPYYGYDTYGDEEDEEDFLF